MRQKPTRLPYSCQAQFGISGDGAPPAGGVNTVRGIGWRMSHSSTLTMHHTTMRAPPGNFGTARPAIGEYAMRSVGSRPTGGRLGVSVISPPSFRPSEARAGINKHETR